MSKVSTDPTKIEELLTRGVHTVYTYEELKTKLLSGKQLHIKLGTDVTGYQLTLGHAVVQRKVRDFQELGHRVTMIIGDFTTLVGDHSDKTDQRNETNLDQIREFEKNYFPQFYRTVLEAQCEIRHNSEWLKELDFKGIIELAKQFTVQQMLDRETTLLRYKNHKPIGLDEFLYPLMQGYDSVALNCDVELGGSDQTFNILAGRKLMESKGKTPQSALMTKLLTGSDGKKMSKSSTNFIPIDASAEDMFGKLMSIADELIPEYMELITRIPMDKIGEYKKEMTNGANPMEFKKILARDVVEFYFDKQKAIKAEEHFANTVQNKNFEESAKEMHIETGTTLLELVKQSGFIASGKEAQRVIEQGGVTVDGVKFTDAKQIIDAKPGSIIKIGKRNAVKLL